MITLPKRFKTNGDITRFLLKIAKDPSHTEDELRNAAIQAMRKFPLSSEKMLYDSDLRVMSQVAQRALFAAAVTTDNAKAKNAIYFLTSNGESENKALESVLPFGRASRKDITK